MFCHLCFPDSSADSQKVLVLGWEWLSLGWETPEWRLVLGVLHPHASVILSLPAGRGLSAVWPSKRKDWDRVGKFPNCSLLMRSWSPVTKALWLLCSPGCCLFTCVVNLRTVCIITSFLICCLCKRNTRWQTQCVSLWFPGFQDCVYPVFLWVFHLSELLIFSLWSDFMPCTDYSREEFDSFLDKIHVLSQIFVFGWDSLMSFNLKPRHSLNSDFFYLPFWAMGTLLCLVELLKLRSMNKYKKKERLSSPRVQFSEGSFAVDLCSPWCSPFSCRNPWCCCLNPQSRGRGSSARKGMYTSEGEWGVRAWQLRLRVKVFS